MCVYLQAKRTVFIFLMKKAGGTLPPWSAKLPRGGSVGTTEAPPPPCKKPNRHTQRMITLIANTGIHLHTFPLEINLNDKFTLWFHEWYNTTNGEWILDLAHEVTTETNRYFYRKKELFDNGYLADSTGEGDIDVSSLSEEGINPIMIDDDMQQGGEVFRMNFADKNNMLAAFENQWLPLPYFFKRSETRFRFGSLNWTRFMLIPSKEGKDGMKRYSVVLACDTRTAATAEAYEECPTFTDQFMTEMQFEVCRQEFQLMDFCSPNPKWDYINNYLFSLAHPDLTSPGKIKKGHRLNYIATYFLLIDYIAQKQLFPAITLYKDDHVQVKDVDMVVDIGNSRTTALLVEDNHNFNQVNQLELTDYTRLLTKTKEGYRVTTYKEPFDMRLAFRRVRFGQFGIQGSRQFVYPGFVRLGREADYLLHQATELDDGQERLSTLSSPKRYLWDGKRVREEWKFMVLDGEEDDHILYIPGLSEHLQSDGRLAAEGQGGQSYHYSRRSLMTFAFLEMLIQARRQVNSDSYRTDRGDKRMPRRVRRIVVTCPTAMSKVEREALVSCASDAVKLLNRFSGVDTPTDVIPAAPSRKDSESRWYYDEATCSQLVYIYGEVGYKYKGACQEFFNLYGHRSSEAAQPELTIGSLDIGAGTSDLMINRYSYTKGDVTTITPTPLFYDSFYYAGDDMLSELVKKLMFFSPESAFRKRMAAMDEVAYRQQLRNFFGPDYTGQTIADRRLRRDFNLQYSVPLMSYFLELLSRGSGHSIVSYADVFDETPPNRSILEGFRRFFGYELSELQWEFRPEVVGEAVSRAFEPLLKKIATMMYAYRCDLVLLSGRPASLPPIRNLFLKYYSVSPGKLILLNNYYVGHWYPFDNNTGYVANPKTIVATGALVGYYAAELANLDRFIIDKTQLDERLKSVVNYIEASREEQPIDYFITPEKSSGELMVSSLPTTLNVRQIGIDSYPSRRLYVIDFNRYKMMKGLKEKALQTGELLNDAQVAARVNEMVDALKVRMPYRLEIERDADDKEQLLITAITDKEGNDVADSRVEINIQSLGADEKYWLDTGAFDIQ